MVEGSKLMTPRIFPGKVPRQTRHPNAAILDHIQDQYISSRYLSALLIGLEVTKELRLYSLGFAIH